jgi:hypothetical protein
LIATLLLQYKEEEFMTMAGLDGRKYIKEKWITAGEKFCVVILLKILTM